MKLTFNEYLKFEKSKKDFFNKLYARLGFTIISRKDNKFYDCVIQSHNMILTVEEKARKKIYSDILIETMQDIKTSSLGWIFYSKADCLIYGMFENNKTIIYKIYPLSWFKFWFGHKIFNFKEVKSEKGWGTTINRIVPIKSIPYFLLKRIF